MRGVTWRDLGAIAVTQGPGLVGSLLVGISAAKSIALSLGVPLVPVHHLAGHIESLFLHNGPLPLPAVVLVVSGGHTSLYLVPEEGEYRLVGRTRDDAAGRRTTRWRSCSGSAIRAGRSSIGWRRLGNDRAIDFPIVPHHAPRSERRRRRACVPRASSRRCATAPTSASAG